MEAGELVLAQEFALEVDRQVWTTNVISTVEKLPVDVQQELVPEMFARQPDNPRLLIMMAELLGGQEGLDLLLELEAGGYSPDQEDEEYGQRKIILMAEAGIFHAKYAEHISEQQLFELAIQLHQAGESQAVDVAQWLKENTANELETGLLQQIVTEAKTPEKLWSADVDDSISELLLSPCGSWLIYNVFKDTTVETHFVHLDSDSWQSPEHPAAGWVWNPEGTMAAGISGDNNIVVYDASNDDTAYIAVQGKLQGMWWQWLGMVRLLCMTFPDSKSPGLLGPGFFSMRQRIVPKGIAGVRLRARVPNAIRKNGGDVMPGKFQPGRPHLLCFLRGPDWRNLRPSSIIAYLLVAPASSIRL